jgi:hypothetical protein
VGVVVEVVGWLVVAGVVVVDAGDEVVVGEVELEVPQPAAVRAVRLRKTVRSPARPWCLRAMNMAPPP